MARALLIVPPLVKYGAGPPLGTARLAAAGRAAGHGVTVLDLNIRHIRRALSESSLRASSSVSNGFVGDWDRPADGSMRNLAHAYRGMLEPLAAEAVHTAGPHNLQFLQGFQHDEVAGMARALAHSEYGEWMKEQLVASVKGRGDPDVVGLSVMFGGQVFAAAAATFVARQLWPSAQLVWGGPHVSALKEDILADAAYGAAVAADAFVFGHAEATFSAMLGRVAAGKSVLAEDCRAAGSGPAASPASCAAPATTSLPAETLPPVAHDFDDLDLYGIPTLTFPVQTSKGCSYGQCTFCTYPAIEGMPGFSPLEETLEPVVALALANGANIGFKDSLVPPRRLAQIAAVVAGRVRWGAYTKLSERLADHAFMAALARGGCGTLELGVESMHPPTQRFISKPQSPDLYIGVLEAAAAAKTVNIVVNYMSGFPHEDPGETQRWADWVEGEAKRILGERALFGNRTFMLEKMAPIGRDPQRFGVEVTARWPWCTSLEYRKLSGDYSHFH